MIGGGGRRAAAPPHRLMSMCRRERLLTAGLQIRRSPDLHSTISSMEERHIQVILAVRYNRRCVENRACSKFSAPLAAGARSAIRRSAMTRQVAPGVARRKVAEFANREKSRTNAFRHPPQCRPPPLLGGRFLDLRKFFGSYLKTTRGYSYG